MSHEVSPKDIPGLVARMRGGDFYARRKLIEAHIGLAFSEASDYRDDEALGEALLALVEAVESFSHTESPPGAFVNYVRAAIKNACVDSLRGRGANRDKKMDSIEALDNSRRFQRSSHQGRTNRAIDELDQVDLVLSICESPVEKDIALLSARGHTTGEVGAKLLTSQGQVSKLVKKMELRLRVQEKLLEERGA